MEPIADEPPEFTTEQMRQALKEIGQSVRAEAFAAGLPVSFIRGNQIVLQYPDGREEIVKTLNSTNDQPQRVKS